MPNTSKNDSRSLPVVPSPIFRTVLMSFMDRQGLSDPQCADLFGVPIHTLKKWISGERVPSSATIRLLHVFCTLEMMAPAILDSLKSR